MAKAVANNIISDNDADCKRLLEIERLNSQIRRYLSLVPIHSEDEIWPTGYPCPLCGEPLEWRFGAGYPPGTPPPFGSLVECVSLRIHYDRCIGPDIDWPELYEQDIRRMEKHAVRVRGFRLNEEDAL